MNFGWRRGIPPPLPSDILAALVQAEWLETEQRNRMVTRVLVGISALQQNPVVVIHSEDLSLAAIRAKIGRLLPLRDREEGH